MREVALIKMGRGVGGWETESVTVMVTLICQLGWAAVPSRSVKQQSR